MEDNHLKLLKDTTGLNKTGQIAIIPDGEDIHNKNEYITKGLILIPNNSANSEKKI